MTTPAIQESKPQFEWPVDENDKATVLRIWNFGRSKKTNPHARAFWFSVISFFFAFVGWFAFAPLMPAVRESIGICDEYGPPDETGFRECVLCGPKCKDVIQNANICSVASTIGVRVASGFLLEKFGPRVVQSAYMAIFAIPVLCAAFIYNGAGLIAVRFFIGGAGATFVTNQFWCSLMFAPNVVGTANATAAGWGNLGGGVTQFLMAGIFSGFTAVLSRDMAWRVSLLVPGVIFIIVSLCVWFFSQDTPHGKFHASMLGKAKTSLWDYVEALRDYRVVLMVFQYAACFGTELQMNNQLALYFFDFFGLPIELAGLAAGAFGFMNLFARSLGGLASDFCFKKYGMRGRFWIHFICLLFEGIMLVAFGLQGSSMFGAAMACLVIFSLFVQASEGTSYGIVPFMMPQHLGIVSALVGAGGNLGAVLTGFIYKYMKDVDANVPFQIHGLCVIAMALTVPFMYWPHFGGMFCKAKPGAVNPHIKFTQSNSSTKVADQSKNNSTTPSDVPSPEDKI